MTNENVSFMYMPPALPSSTRHAPAKNRIWSHMTANSSSRKSCFGLPQFLHSAFAINSLFASNASAIFKSIVWHSDGVVCLKDSKAFAAALMAASTSAAFDLGAVAKGAPVAGFTSTVVSVEALPTAAPLT